MFRLLNGSLQTVNTNSSHRKQLFENVSNFVSITAGRNRSSQDELYSCVPAVIVPPQQTDCTNTASPIKMTQGQLMLNVGSSSGHRWEIRKRGEEQSSTDRMCWGDLGTWSYSNC